MTSILVSNVTRTKLVKSYNAEFYGAWLTGPGAATVAIVATGTSGAFTFGSVIVPLTSCSTPTVKTDLTPALPFGVRCPSGLWVYMKRRRAAVSGGTVVVVYA